MIELNLVTLDSRPCMCYVIIQTIDIHPYTCPVNGLNIIWYTLYTVLSKTIIKPQLKHAKGQHNNFPLWSLKEFYLLGEVGQNHGKRSQLPQDFIIHRDWF